MRRECSKCGTEITIEGSKVRLTRRKKTIPVCNECRSWIREQLLGG